MPQNQIPDVNNIVNEDLVNNLASASGLSLKEIYEYLLLYNFISEEIKPEQHADPNKTYYWTQLGLNTLLQFGMTQSQLPKIYSALNEQQINYVMSVTGFSLQLVYQYLFSSNLITDKTPESEPEPEPFPEPINDGVAKIKITGSNEVGSTLGIQIETDDKDGNGNLLTGGSNYQWYSNNNKISNGTSPTYTVSSNDQEDK